MQITAGKTQTKSLWQKQIPTILGLLVLVVGLIGGIIFTYSGQNTFFAPRATPQTTPKNVKITNVTDTGFTVSFLTDEATTGFVKYGTAANALNTQASDDRDQLSGSVGKFTTHHVTVLGLQPKTQYFFTLGTASSSSFDNNGSPYTVTTAARVGTPPAAKTIYGKVLTAGGSPAEGSIVYVTINGVGQMSSLVKSSSNWAVPLSNARATDGSQYASIQDADSVTLLAQGPQVNLTAQATVTVKEAQPAPDLSLGGTADRTLTTQNTRLTTDATKTVDPAVDDLGSSSATFSARDTTGIVSPRGVRLNPSATPGATGSAALADTGSVQTFGSQSSTSSSSLTSGTGGSSSSTGGSSSSSSDGNVASTNDEDEEFGGELLAQANPTATPRASATASPRASASPSPKASTKPSATPFGSGNPFPVSTSSSKTSTSSTKTSTSSTRTSVPSTASGIPVSGSVETTFALMLGGLFFIGSGVWSYWIARQFEADAAEVEEGV